MSDRAFLLQGKMKCVPALKGQQGIWKQTRWMWTKSFGFSSRARQPLVWANNSESEISTSRTQWFLIFFLIYLSFQSSLKIFKTPAFFSCAKKMQANNVRLGQHFWRTVRNVPVETGIGGHSNLCSTNGPGNRLRFLDQPLLANWQSLFSVKFWHFWVGFNKKTFSEALIRLLWTQLGTEPKNLT